MSYFLFYRGVEELGPSFSLPTCAHVFNIYHPVSSVSILCMKMSCSSYCCIIIVCVCDHCDCFHFQFDPVAYRLEPLVVSQSPERAVLMPHHKGRKRFHLGEPHLPL